MARVLMSVCLLLPAAAAQSSGVEGSVIDRVTGAGIEGVPIVLYTRQAVRYETMSGPAGTFRVSGVQPGVYEARVDENGYRVFRRDPERVTLAAGQTVRMTVEMTRLTTFRGRVIDASGAPLAGVEVTASRLPAAKTNDAGEFAIEGAEPASYSILATPPAAVRQSEGGERTALIPAYYNGGRRVIARGDGDVSGLEIRLEPAPVYRVRGTVFDETGRPLAAARVQLLEDLRARATTRSGEDGSFEFPAVWSGPWRVAAFVDGTIDTRNLINTTRSASVEVSVGRGDVDGVSLRMAAPFSLTGAIDWGGAPVGRLIVRLQPADGRLSVPPTPAAATPDGSFRIDMILPGKYVVSPGAPPGYYASAVMLGGTDIMDRAVDLLPGSPPLRIVYARARGGVRGRVSNPGVTTVLLLRRELSVWRFVNAAPCGADGSFEFANLPPGEYYAAAFDRIEQTVYTDPALIERAATTGVRATVSASQVSIELRAARWPE